MRGLLFCTILVGLMLALSVPLCGQGYYLENLYEPTSDSVLPHKVRLSAIGEGFFRNNEYNSSIYTGYTLPGFRAWLWASYDLPVWHGAKLSGGLYTIRYWGANRYPVVAYQDIGYWTDTKKSRAFRLLPLFRISVRPSAHSIITLGAINGASAHRLVEPVYNPELNLTADPEMGIQYRLVAHRLFLDAWINWESFIYKRDDHQEAFSAGISSEILLSRNIDREVHKWQLSCPWAFTAAHRGGEYNLTQSDTVHTWLNGYVGFKGSYLIPVLRGIDFSVASYLMGYTQRGQHYASDKGYGFYGRIAAEHEYVSISAAYWHGKGWIAPYGLPFANAIDAKGNLWNPYGMSNYWQGQISLHYKWGKSFTAGLSSSLFLHPMRAHPPSCSVEAYMAIRTATY